MEETIARLTAEVWRELPGFFLVSEETEKEEKKSFLVAAALVVDIDSGMRKAGFLVSGLPMLCSRRGSAGLSSQASWLVWTRRTVLCAMLVLQVTMHLELCFLLSSIGPGCPASWQV